MLTIDQLDEISVGLFAGVHIDREPQSVAELIPFAEWLWLKAAGHALPDIKAVEQLAGVRRALNARRLIWRDAAASRAGFIRIRRCHSEAENVEWVSFRLALTRAAKASGLPTSLANQLAGVVTEMEDNIHWHSQRARSGLVAFLAHDGRFEFIVLDLGRGVLSSLKEAPEFVGLSDHGAALKAAIARENSRFGKGSGRGWGFDELVVGVANANAAIRFRSGDHLLELNGTGQKMTSRLVQRAMSRGFMIAVEVHA